MPSADDGNELKGSPRCTQAPPPAPAGRDATGPERLAAAVLAVAGCYPPSRWCGARWPMMRTRPLPQVGQGYPSKGTTAGAHPGAGGGAASAVRSVSGRVARQPGEKAEWRTHLKPGAAHAEGSAGALPHHGGPSLWGGHDRGRPCHSGPPSRHRRRRGGCRIARCGNFSAPDSR